MGHARPWACLGPNITQCAFLPDARFILEPEFNLFVFGTTGKGFLDCICKVFLKASMAAGSFSGWTGRETWVSCRCCVHDRWWYVRTLATLANLLAANVQACPCWNKQRGLLAYCPWRNSIWAGHYPAWIRTTVQGGKLHSLWISSLLQAA